MMSLKHRSSSDPEVRAFLSAQQDELNEVH